MVSWLFCFLCFTSSVSLTGFYTEDELKIFPQTDGCYRTEAYKPFDKNKKKNSHINLGMIVARIARKHAIAWTLAVM